jgi:hypothetical protein
MGRRQETAERGNTAHGARCTAQKRHKEKPGIMGKTKEGYWILDTGSLSRARKEVRRERWNYGMMEERKNSVPTGSTGFSGSLFLKSKD